MDDHVVVQKLLYFFGYRFRFLAQLFLKKTSRCCHSPVVGGGVVSIMRKL